jgi:cation:H+ antiporter
VISAIPLLLVAFGVILAAAELFTNGVEWIGVRLGLGHGAVGSILAAFGTAMPETTIPIIAIIFVGSADANDVGVGAILGAPFLLSTAAFAVAGLSLLAYAKRRRHGATMRIDAEAITRDFSVFFIVYMGGIGSSFIHAHAPKVFIAAVLLLIYGYYVFRAVSSSGEGGSEEELVPLRFHDVLGAAGAPPTWLVWAQVVVALAAVIGGAYLFVTEIERISTTLSLPPLILSLVVAPLATELPETFNSVIWVRQEKDTLAMGNISGAMVFQSAIPVSIGVLFTTWRLTATALVSAAIALGSTAIVFFSLRRHGHVDAPVLTRAGLLWLAFVVYVVVKSAVK